MDVLSEEALIITGYKPEDEPHARIRSFVVPIYIPTMLLATSVFAVLPGLPEHLGSIGAPVALIGTIAALRGLGTLVMDLPGGIVLARIGAKRIMMAAAGLLAAAMLLMALAPHLIPTAFGVLCSGGAISAFFLGMQSHIRGATATQQRGKALSGTGGSLRIGALLGPAVGGAIGGRLGMEWAFTAAAVMAAASLLMVLFFLRDRRPAPAGPRGRPSAGGTSSDAAPPVPSRRIYRELLTRPVPGMYVVGGAVVALMLLRAAREFVLPLWGGHIGLGVETIGYAMSAGALFDLLLFVPAGLIMDRYGRRIAASLCMGLFTLGVALLPFTTGVATFAAAAVLIGIGNGFGAGLNLTLGSDLAPPEREGHFLGLWRLFGDIGGTIGPNLVGAVAALLALPAAIGAVAAVGVLGTGIMLFAAPETGSPRAEKY